MYALPGSGVLRRSQTDRSPRLPAPLRRRPISHVQTVHEAPQEQAATGLGLDEQLALGRLQALGVLQGEVGANESAGLLQPGLHLVGVLEQVHDPRVLVPVGGPLAGQELEGRLRETIRGRKIVKPLQHAVDHGALVRGQ